MASKLGKGWFYESRRHSLAAKGIRTGRKIKEPIVQPHIFKSKDFDIFRKVYSINKEGDKFKLSLGNLTDAGWYWSGNEDDMAGFLIRVNNSGIRDEFISDLKAKGVDYKRDIKPSLLESIKSSEWLYMLSGDNQLWEFGSWQNEHPEYLTDDWDTYTEEEKRQIEEAYWGNLEWEYSDYADSDYVTEVKSKFKEIVESSNNPNELFEGLNDERFRELIMESVGEYMSNVQNNAMKKALLGLPSHKQKQELSKSQTKLSGFSKAKDKGELKHGLQTKGGI